VLAAKYLQEMMDSPELSGHVMARTFLRALVEGHPLHHFSGFQAALVPAGAGHRRLVFFQQITAEVAVASKENDDALNAIERGITTGLVDIMWLDHCPLFVELRAHARFIALRATVEERAARVREAFGS